MYLSQIKIMSHPLRVRIGFVEKRNYFEAASKRERTVNIFGACKSVY